MVDETEEKTEVTELPPPEKPPVDKKSLIIRVVIVLGLAYYGVTEFILKEEPPPPPPVAKAKPKLKFPPKKKADENVAEAKKDEAKKSEGKPEEKKEEPKKEAEVKINPPKEEAPPAVENISITKKEEENLPGTIVIEPPPVAEKDIDKKIDQLIDKEEGKEIKPAVIKPKERKSKEIKTAEKKEEKEAVDMKDKIVGDDIYTEPPPYDLLGRGLVYNCREKYWACTSKSAYIMCNKNMKWNQAHGKPAECVVKNVYASDEDCEAVQKYNISTNESTGFCKQ